MDRKPSFRPGPAPVALLNVRTEFNRFPEEPALLALPMQAPFLEAVFACLQQVRKGREENPTLLAARFSSPRPLYLTLGRAEAYGIEVAKHEDFDTPIAREELDQLLRGERSCAFFPNLIARGASLAQVGTIEMEARGEEERVRWRAGRPGGAMRGEYDCDWLSREFFQKCYAHLLLSLQGEEARRRFLFLAGEAPAMAASLLGRQGAGEFLSAEALSLLMQNAEPEVRLAAIAASGRLEKAAGGRCR